MTEARSALKKVVCPACGLVNLEKFVTFPHCAGCGALLAEDAAASPLSVWRRPLHAPMWATIIGLCCVAVGILGIGIARETGRTEERQLMVYTQMPRHMQLGRASRLQFVLDTMAGSSENNISEFSDVQLSFSHSLQPDFTIVGVAPTPDRITSSPRGDFIEFDSLPRDEPIRLLIRPYRTGTRRLSFTLFVGDFMPFQFRTSVPVAPPAPGVAGAPGAPGHTQKTRASKSPVSISRP